MRVGPRSVSSSLSTGAIKRVMTQMTSGNLGQIVIYTSSSGDCRFALGSANNQSLQLSFSLAETHIYVGPSIAASIANPSYIIQTASFQRYRIDRVEVSMYIGSNMQTDQGSSVSQPLGVTEMAQPIVMYVVDSDDSNPLNQDLIQSYGNMQMKQATLGSPIQCSFRPSALRSMNNSTGSTVNAGTVFSPICSTDFPEVEHFGMKFVATDFSVFPAATTKQAAVNFVVKYHMTFFDPK